MLGQNQTTEAEANRASATAGLEVTRDIRNDDASLVEGVFNQLLMWICELNFNVDILPTFELFEQENIDKLQAERDKLLTEIGVGFTAQYIHRTYGFEDGDIIMQAVEKADKSAKTADFAEPIPKSVIETIGEQLEVEGEAVVETWLHDIRDRLGQAESLEDFRNQLDSLIPELSYAEYGELLAWGSTAAQFAGRQSVEDERK